MICGPAEWIEIATFQGRATARRLDQLGVPVDGDDLVGDLILELVTAKPSKVAHARRLAKLRSIDWMRRVYGRRAADGTLYWSQIATELTDAVLERLIDPDPGPDELLERKERATEIARTLRRLTLREHTVVALLAAGHSAADVAVWMGLHPSAVTRLTNGARTKLSQLSDAA